MGGAGRDGLAGLGPWAHSGASRQAGLARGATHASAVGASVVRAIGVEAGQGSCDLSRRRTVRGRRPTRCDGAAQLGLAGGDREGLGVRQGWRGGDQGFPGSHRWGVGGAAVRVDGVPRSQPFIAVPLTWAAK